MDRPYLPRPVEDYESQGDQAHYDGKSAKDCPHPDGTLAAADWVLGLRRAAEDHVGIMLSDGEGDDGDGEIARHHAIADRGMARRARGRILEEARAALPSLADAEAAVGSAAPEWESRCYEVSCLIAGSGILAPMEAAFGPAAARYGVYDGRISDESIFGGRRFARHGWIEFASGLVLDPTRFVFEAREPSLWVGSIDDYDLGGCRLRRSVGVSGRPAPAHDPAERQIRWVSNDPEATDAAGRLLGDLDGLRGRMCLGAGQAFWLANLPPEAIGAEAPAVYRALEQAGCAGFIPADSRMHVLGPKASSGPRGP